MSPVYRSSIKFWPIIFNRCLGPRTLVSATPEKLVSPELGTPPNFPIREWVTVFCKQAPFGTPLNFPIQRLGTREMSSTSRRLSVRSSAPAGSLQLIRKIRCFPQVGSFSPRSSALLRIVHAEDEASEGFFHKCK